MAAKRPREPLSRERALAVAIAIADKEGIPALTMRRLATELGVEAMSLYHHLPGKEGLLDGLAEAVIAQIEAEVARTAETGSKKDWRTRLRRRFLSAREVMLRHPWAPALLSSRPTIPTAVYAYYDAIVATLVDGGFSYRIAHRAIHAFGSLALGFAQEIFRPASAGGNTDVDVAEADLAAMAGALPHLTAMVAAELHDLSDPTLGWCDSQVEFEYTLDLLLDGLERDRG
ncbi:TetR/AcrR family transcriptional regulator C-terminal domain-containing protein [Micromonospora sp. NBC_01796]|uniref:TetR/AcrR family transcriptional regulator C-terminal domain-containing protein n=1 Tax=Micromonospora sp. NBC_01796 TaxID=2975987 RepID=UPI002DDB1A2C|nr:TetR/AcrR family transcriptional regulator C-terminal domain-containing protein [Micromonospora sp. NBC_01796]WSA88242.1 TetR/AcrR family transcriptional regulator C-terminal domain-containing protein [Micromonospora sp. NBC_01796]